TNALADGVFGQIDLSRNTSNFIDAAGLSAPKGIALDRSVIPNRLYVVDSDNSRVLAWADASAFGSGTPADMVIGQPDFYNGLRNWNGGLVAGPSTLQFPRGIAVDTGGNLYVADSGNNRVLIYDNPFLNDTAADQVIGQGGNFTTIGGCEPGVTSNQTLCEPKGLALDASNNLFVADTTNHRVLFYTNPRVSDQIADRVFGRNNSFSANQCVPVSTEPFGLCSPIGLAVDSLGNLFISDFGNNRILEYNGAVSTTPNRVYGQNSFTTNSANFEGLDSKSLYHPIDLTIDAEGHLYVVDSGNHRVLRYLNPLDLNYIVDGNIFGQDVGRSNNPNFPNGKPAPEGMFGPFGVGVDSEGGVYISDTGNHRVLAFFPNRPPVASAGPDQVIEQSQLGGASVVLDGFGSTDADGDLLSYTWTWETETFTGINPTVFLPLGNHIITLVV
ncbi:MAG TPA: hypothetical protein VLB09_09785, partial [Nitrospiria bacterium]|nr:hypothetical protein [Nitrospiria bacterium]